MAAPIDPSILTPEYLAADEGPEVLRTITAMAAISTLFFGLRIVVRLRRSGFGIGADDWFLFAAVCFNWALYGFGTHLIVLHGGLGRHLPVVLMEDPHMFESTLLGLYIGGFVYPSVIACIKASVLCMYFRIFPTKFIKWGLIGLGGFTAAWWLTVVLVTIFQCTPIHAAWELALQPAVNPNSKCINNNGFFIGNAVPNIVTDLCIMVLPLHEVYKLHISRSQKIALSGVFMLGALVIVASIIKLNVTVQLFSEAHADYTYRLKDFIIWTMVETGVGIISASLPPLRPLLTATLRTVGLSRDSSKNPSGKSDRMTIGGGGSGKKSYKSTGSTETSTLVAVTRTDDTEMARGPFKQIHDQHDYELSPSPNQWPRVYRSGINTAVVDREHATINGYSLPLDSVGAVPAPVR
ncbi:hypothetical protein KVR01_005918 [Diaporthe batatas]|uniref:uncharacterized protein n=1 Tax=Diaporthe batatas TaxID=748121 RepID=UPI001D04F8C0|nr:uncharacterized protein KVR01_005918 [Diaporthe batatas]KAG8164000.1 hypothetical protein KVR01_005918 [Diaporthe batatas]